MAASRARPGGDAGPSQSFLATAAAGPPDHAAARLPAFRLLHLDLLVLLGFSISHIYLNRGEIGTSVPLVYPVLLYLLVRMLLFVYRPGFSDEDKPVRSLVPVRYLAIGLVALAAGHVVANVSTH